MSNKTDFNNALAFTLTWEGGLTVDSGGLTKYGIDAKSHPNLDISDITLNQAKNLYYNEYWKPFESLPAIASILCFDAAVNCGVGHATEWLQETVGVNVDGIIGPQTIKATELAIEENPKRFVYTYQALRSLYYAELGIDYKQYKYGWYRRIHDLTLFVDELYIKKGFTG